MKNPVLDLKSGLKYFFFHVLNPSVLMNETESAHALEPSLDLFVTPSYKMHFNHTCSTKKIEAEVLFTDL